MSQQENYDPDSSVKVRKALLGSVDFSVWTERLTKFLAKQPGVRGNVAISDMRVPTSGGSSGTLMFTAEYDAAGGRQRNELVLRYATEGGLFHTYNLPGQYAILKGLQGTGVPIPPIAGIDADGSVLGVIGYLMARVDGEAPPPSYFKLGSMFDATPENRRKMIFGAIAAQAKFHALDWKTLGIEFLMKRGNGKTALERDLDWHFTSLSWGCPNDLENVQPMRQWLLKNQPDEKYIGLCHGDAMIPNYMFVGNRLTAVLDWELAFLGHPTNDVAYQAFTHAFLGLGCAPLEGCPTIQERKDEYERVSARKLEHWDYFYTVACFKVMMSMMLVFREVPPEMEAVKKGSLDFIWQCVLENQAKCQA